ncbi:hypothetical protein QBC35DRAFT_554373 [Podospora australis]|uniref:SET domain-containing protein n=1 Tax=Podospora australis TaxID=1536484 RepID=A0AAN6WTQ0_9PEZI|nr:hypothetical protein QBC35DRAFT_554373 [Podospora australis]
MSKFPIASILSLSLVSITHATVQQSICGHGIPKTPVDADATVCIDSEISPPSSPSAWAPWTHIPHCVEAEEEPWCVYTNAGFPRGHGISIITTPDQASDALNILTHAMDKPFFAPEKLYSTTPYEIREIPGKGKGVVATQKIEKGRALLVDYATVLAAAEYPADVMHEEVRELMDAAVDRLGEPERVKTLSRLGRDSEEASEVEDLLLTNSFVVGVGGKDYMGLFADVARFNHDCKPNAFIHFSETTLAMTIWVARDIKAGEEITISYAAAGMVSKERQKTLEEVWGFKCQCTLCSAPKDVLEASDERRQKIRKFQAKVPELAQKGEFHSALEAAEEMFELIETEGLTEQMGDMYEIPARIYYHVGNLEKALEYTLKVKHEINGYGFPGKYGEQKLKILDGVLKRIKSELEKKKNLIFKDEEEKNKTG